MSTNAIVVYLPNEHRSFALNTQMLNMNTVKVIVKYLNQRTKGISVQNVFVIGIEDYSEYAIDKIYESEANFMQRIFEEQLFDPRN